MRFFYLCFSVIIIGSLVRLMHWPNGKQIIAFGEISILVVYTIHFFLKPIKAYPDWLKLLWVFLTVSHIVLEIFTTVLGVFNDVLSLLSSAVFVVLLLFYIAEEKRLRNQTNEIEGMLASV